MRMNLLDKSSSALQLRLSDIERDDTIMRCVRSLTIVPAHECGTKTAVATQVTARFGYAGRLDRLP